MYVCMYVENNLLNNCIMQSNEALNNTTCAEKNVKLPDLNMPQSATAPSQEPMTETQKMQLRAQIFVYGCLV